MILNFMMEEFFQMMSYLLVLQILKLVKQLVMQDF